MGAQAPTPPTAAEPTPTTIAPVLPMPPRRSWGRLFAELTGMLLLGLLVGLSIPMEGRTGWPALLAGETSASSRSYRAQRHLALPVMPWQLRRKVDPAVAELALSRAWCAPPEQVPYLFTPEPPLHFGADPLPEPYDGPPPPSHWRKLALPDLGPDPLALPPYLSRRLADQRLPLRGIEPLARLAQVPVLMYHDIVLRKEVSFDHLLSDFVKDLETMERLGIQPITLRQWWNHMTRGDDLPEKPVLITFDDGYKSVYEFIYPRLLARGWPAVFFVCSDTVGKMTSRDHVSWDEAREMAATGLFEFQSHSVDHARLADVSLEECRRQLKVSKERLEAELGRPAQFICYPYGSYNAQVIEIAKQLGYITGFTVKEGVSAESPGMMEIKRYDHRQLMAALRRADGRIEINAPPMYPQADLTQPVTFHRQVFTEQANQIPVCWVTGGRPTSVFADSRYAVPDVAQLANVPAAINGGFFQLALIRVKETAMIGPVLASQTTEVDDTKIRSNQFPPPRRLLPANTFHPGVESDNLKIADRPLVLISRRAMRFVPFVPHQMNSRRAFEILLPGVREAFVGGGWLVKDGRALTRAEMDAVSTWDHDHPRRRAFLGIDRQGRPVIGAVPSSQTSATVARCLQQIGLVHAALLDSGFSSSLYYNGNIFVTGHSSDTPSRPVPHLILLHHPDDPVARVAGLAATKLEASARWAAGDDQAEHLPPRLRVVTAEEPPPAPARRRRR